MADNGSGGLVVGLIAAVGGLLSGVAALITALNVAPNIVNVIMPPAALERAGLKPTPPETVTVIASPQPAQSTPIASAVQADPPAPHAPAAPPAQAHTIAPGLSVSLASIAARDDQFVATLRIYNTSSAPIGMAVLWRDSFNGEFTISDGLGGSCSMSTRSGLRHEFDVLGTSPSRSRRDVFLPAPPGGAPATRSIVFVRRYCTSPIEPGAPLSLSGTFVLERNGARSLGPVSFDAVTPR